LNIKNVGIKGGIPNSHLQLTV